MEVSHHFSGYCLGGCLFCQYGTELEENVRGINGIASPNSLVHSGVDVSMIKQTPIRPLDGYSHGASLIGNEGQDLEYTIALEKGAP